MKTKKYLILYYVSFLLTLILSCVEILAIKSYIDELIPVNIGLVLLFAINAIMVSIISFSLAKNKKTSFNSTAFPTIYLAFLIVVIILCFIFNTKAMEQYLHFIYYSTFILIGYLLLNIYTFLCIDFKK